MAIGFNSPTINAAQGFLGGFTGMDKYLVERRATVRQQAFNEAVRQEMETFSTGYYDALNDPSKQRDFYANHPIVTSNMLRSGGGGGSRGTKGIFGSGSSTTVPNIYGKFYSGGQATAATGSGTGKTQAEVQQQTIVNEQPAPGQVTAPADPRVNPYGTSFGKNFNTTIDPFDLQVMQGANPLARPSLTPAQNLTQDQFTPFSMGDLTALNNENQVPFPRSGSNPPVVTNAIIDAGKFVGSQFMDFIAPDQTLGPVTQLPNIPSTAVPQIDPLTRQLGTAFANDDTLFDPLTGLPRR